MEKRRKTDNDTVNQWWDLVRPYWHVISVIIICTFIATTKLSNIEAYSNTLEAHEKRLTALEVWQAGASTNLAAMKQEVDDIHERIVGK